MIYSSLVLCASDTIYGFSFFGGGGAILENASNSAPQREKKVEKEDMQRRSFGTRNRQNRSGGREAGRRAGVRFPKGCPGRALAIV